MGNWTRNGKASRSTPKSLSLLCQGLAAGFPGGIRRLALETLSNDHVKMSSMISCHSDRNFLGDLLRSKRRILINSQLTYEEDKVSNYEDQILLNQEIK
ncbi:hypothetical protein ACTXT7_007679 [Hymenolepis weldensis]